MTKAVLFEKRVSEIRFVRKLVLLILPFLLLPSYSLAESLGDVERVMYVHNSDGDTITFDLPAPHSLRIPIRINGIDTPEMKGKCKRETHNAQQAQQMVADILKDAEQITLKNIEKGKYFEVAADVYVDGKNLAGMLVVNGMAVEYNGERKIKNWCK